MSQKLLQLAAKYDTPLYVYDADIIQSQYKLLRQSFDKISFRVKYAAKALTNINILKLLKQCGSELDAVSINEIQLGLMSGFLPSDIIFTPSSVSFDEIKEAYELGVMINIGSLSMLRKFAQFYNGGSCSLRFNPDITAGGNIKIQTGHSRSKFGIPKQQIDEVLKIVQENDVQVTGLHIHTGSDIVASNTFLQIADILYELARYFPNLSFLDMGSGLKVRYKETDAFTDVGDLARKLTPSFQDFCASYGKKVELWLEPGKFLVSQAGKFLVKVNQIKKNEKTKFAGVNSGLNHLLRPMLYNAYHHITNLTNPSGKPQKYDIVGYICEEDTFAQQRSIAEISEGDILCFFNAGAYGYSMSSNYNSRCRPAEVMIYEGQDYLIRKRETLNDILCNQISVF